MKDLSEQTHYEVLELAPGCGDDDLARAYTQAKERYAPGSLATYALVEPGEAEALLRRVEEAFAVLSDPERRRAYDSAQGTAAGAPRPTGEEGLAAAAPAPLDTQVVPSPEPQPAAALESVPHPESPAPAQASPAAPPETSPVASPAASPVASVVSPAPAPASPAASPPPASPQPSPPASFVAPLPVSEPPPEPKPVHRTESDLPADAAVTGDALRRVREARGLSLKDVEGRTKIGHWHLENIERERYADLPAQVYLRGFLMSLARELKLDPLRVARSYLEQMKVKHQAKPE